MTPNHESSSSDEDDAPESHSLIESKRTIQKRDNALATFRATEKSKIRTLNRARDRTLKERAEKKKHKGKEVIKVVPHAEARMEWPIREVQMDEDQGLDADDDLERSEIPVSDEDGSGEGEDRQGDEVVGSEVDGDEDEGMELKMKPNPNHLPDHLFASAFTSNTLQNSSTKPKPENNNRPTRSSRKRSRHNRALKDLIIGSRTIRTLSDDGPPSAASTIPSRKVRKFIDRSLGFKSGNLKTKGWERRAVNIGVLKRDGPASSFVRNC